MSRLRRALRPLWFLPDPVEPVPVVGVGPALPRGRPFVVLSWNLQFAAGRTGSFFYDGGPDVCVSPAEVESTLAGIAALIRREAPDLVLLQEVDVRSRRTGWVDQHARLHRELGLPVRASTPYFRVPFVPVPPHDPLGPVHMVLAVHSRFGLQPGVRHALAPLDEPVWRRIFNLRRALQHHAVPLEGGGALQLLQTHLSAFARGDGSLERQAVQVCDVVRSTSGPALLAGDFNSLLPGDDPARLGFASVLYSDATPPLAPLLDTLELAFPPAGAGPAGWTYVPWGSNRPDRTLDYAFVRDLVVHEARALSEGAAWSDHLPVRLVLEVPERGSAQSSDSVPTVGGVPSSYR